MHVLQTQTVLGTNIQQNKYYTYIESISFNLQICARRKSRTLHCSTKKYILYLISKYVFNMYLKSFFIYLQDERCKDIF